MPVITFDILLLIVRKITLFGCHVPHADRSLARLNEDIDSDLHLQ